MTITLTVDSKGNPYLRLRGRQLNEEETLEDKLLEVFIRRSFRHGIMIESDASYEANYENAIISIMGDK